MPPIGLRASELANNTIDPNDTSMPWWYRLNQQIMASPIGAMGSPRPTRQAVSLWGYNAVRASNTMLKGAYAGSAEDVGKVRRGLNRWFNPRSLTRYPYQEQIDPGGKHSSFQVAKALNWTVQGGEKGIGFGSRRVFQGRGPLSYLPGVNVGTEDIGNQTVVGGGSVSRQLTSWRMERGATPKQLANAGKYLDRTNPDALRDWNQGAVDRSVLPFDAGGEGQLALTKNLSLKETYGAMSSSMEDALQGTDRLTAAQLMGGVGANNIVGQYFGGYMGSAAGWRAGQEGLTEGARGMAEARGKRIAEQTGKDYIDASLRGSKTFTDAMARSGFQPGEKMTIRKSLQGAKNAYRSTVDERIAGRAGGKAAEEVVGKTAEKAVGEAAAGTVERATAREAAEGALAGLGTLLAENAAADWIPVVGQAFMIYSAIKTGMDIGKLAYTLGNAYVVQPALKFAKEANRSFQGNLNKAPMSGFWGKGFIDNEVTATSRSRGVMAIQNSRLNARSVLGSEASMLYQHFG